MWVYICIYGFAHVHYQGNVIWHCVLDIEDIASTTFLIHLLLAKFMLQHRWMGIVSKHYRIRQIVYTVPISSIWNYTDLSTWALIFRYAEWIFSINNKHSILRSCNFYNKSCYHIGFNWSSLFVGFPCSSHSSQLMS